MPLYLKILLPCLVLLVLVLCYFLYCFIVVFVANRKVLGSRGKDPKNPCYLRFEDYEKEIKRVPYLTGYYKNAIRGYIYSEKGRKDFKGFVILSHGLFGTHVQYLMDMYLLCHHGYKVLAYDNYGVGLSDGREEEYLAHGIYVMENVIKDVEENDLNDGLPLILYGHSWGGYSSLGASRDHPEIKAVIARGAPTTAMQSGKDLLKRFAPKLYRSIAPFYGLAVRMLLGHRNRISSLRGPKKNRTTRYLILHSKDDPMVPFDSSAAKYYLDHPQQNVEVKLTEQGGHNTLITPEGQKNYDTAVKEYYKIYDEKGKDAPETKAYGAKLERRKMFPYREEVSGSILSFLEEVLGK